MDWYEILIIIAAAAFVVGIVARRIVLHAKGKGGCDCGCGNGAACKACAAHKKKEEQKKITR